MHRPLALLAAVVFLVAAGSVSSVVPRVTEAAPVFNEAACDDRALSPEGFDRSRMRCGFVTVEESSRSDTRMIDIWAVVIEATSPNPEPDPIVFLPGGPGQPGVDFAAYSSEWYSQALDDRDFI
ncbi:MAG: hypothetical protein WD359_02060 [Dehalococcoidia bacterium]